MHRQRARRYKSQLLRLLRCRLEHTACIPASCRRMKIHSRRRRIPSSTRVVLTTTRALKKRRQVIVNAFMCSPKNPSVISHPSSRPTPRVNNVTPCCLHLSSQLLFRVSFIIIHINVTDQFCFIRYPIWVRFRLSDNLSVTWNSGGSDSDGMTRA